MSAVAEALDRADAVKAGKEGLNLLLWRDDNRARDAARKSAGGQLAGVPVVVKDNIATADKMMTTAGSLALVGAIAPRDAPLVARLRDAGAVILGKTNLSEWANIRSTQSSSGWSARGWADCG